MQTSKGVDFVSRCDQICFICRRQNAQRAALRAAGQATSGNARSLLSFASLVRFSHIAKGASKMLRATGHAHARMVSNARTHVLHDFFNLMHAPRLRFFESLPIMLCSRRSRCVIDLVKMARAHSPNQVLTHAAREGLRAKGSG